LLTVGVLSRKRSPLTREPLFRLAANQSGVAVAATKDALCGNDLQRPRRVALKMLFMTRDTEPRGDS